MVRFRIALLLVASLLAVFCQAQEKPIPLTRITGKWVTEDGKVLTIRRLDESTVVAKGESGVEWRGTYSQNALRLSAWPPASAMNPDIPEWARRLLQQQRSLEWKLNLQASEAADGLKLKGDLLPGEVEWKLVTDPNTNETIKHQVSVTGGTGTPIKLAYTKGQDWAIADTIVLSAKVDKPKGGGVPCSYTLFAYGPRLPSTRQAIKPLVLETDGVKYLVLGCKNDQLPQGDKDLMAKGWQEAKKGISASDAAILNKEWGAVLLEAQVEPNVMPGYRRLRIGTATSGWFLDQGCAQAKLSLWREIKDSPGEPTNYVFHGERFRAQVDAGPRYLNPSTGEVELLVGVNGAWLTTRGQFNAKFDSALSTGSSIFVSPPIEVVNDTDPRVPPLNDVAMVGGVFLVKARQGSNVQVSLADPMQFMCPEPAANMFISILDEAPWVTYLRRAAQADGLPADIDLRGSRGKTVAEVTDTMITQVAFRYRLQYLSPLVRFIQFCYGFSDAEMAKGEVDAKNTVKLGDHAAALLLRDEFLTQLQPIVDALNAIKTNEDKLGYLDACASELKNPNSAMANIEMVESSGNTIDPNAPTVTWKLGEVYASNMPGEARKSLLLEGFDSYKSYVLNAQRKAVAIEDKDIQGLFALTGDCFTTVVKAAMPKLMRPVVDDKGSVTWEPDPIARREVKEVNTAWEAIKAQKEWKSLDREVAVAAATCSLQFGGLFFKVIARLSALANIAMGIEASYSSLDAMNQDAAKEMFAIGASQVLGSGRYEMVQQQKTPAWALAVNLISLGLISAGDVPVLLGKTQAGEAMAQAQRAATTIRQGGLKAFENLSTQEKTAFLATASAVQRKSAKAATTLLDNEKEVEQAFKQISAELEQRGGYNIKIEPAKPGLPEPAPSEPVLPQRQVTPESPSPNPVAATTESPTTLKMPDYKLKCRVNGRAFQATPEEIAQLRAKGVQVAVDRPPAGYPQRMGRWQYRDQPFELGEQVGQGALFGVFEEIGTPDVIKVSKWLAGSQPGKTLYDDIKLAKELLERNGIEHLPIRMGPRPQDHELLWIAQKKLEPGWIVPRAGQMLDPSQREAVMDLMEQLYKARLVAEDLKTDNIFLRPLGNGKWKAGILDVDRVCMWGQNTEPVEFVMKLIETGNVDGQAFKLNCVITGSRGSAAEGQRLITYEEFWKAQMEKGAWLAFGNDTAAQKVQFMSSVLDADEVFKRFSFLRRKGERVVLRGRPPITPKPPSLLEVLDGWLRTIAIPAQPAFAPA